MPAKKSASKKKSTKRTTRKKTAPRTTAQRLSAIIKSARQIMRKDKGLNGDLDRLPLFTWVLFLKFLDDMETAAEGEATIAGKPHQPVIDPPYRWRDWAAAPDGITGDELLSFLSQDETTRPDGSRGPGLFAYLRSLRSDSGTGRRDVIANVFKGVTNRMESGYLLRDVINKVSGIHFTASEEQSTLQKQGDDHYWPIYNLDHKNPNSAEALEYRPPRELIASVLEKEHEILRLMEEIQTEVEELA